MILIMAICCALHSCDMTIDDYDDFLAERRHLMARMIEEYYKQL